MQDYLVDQNNTNELSDTLYKEVEIEIISEF